MPSSMIHLLAAIKYNPDGETPFYIGCVAPDIISDRGEKDKTHFRDGSGSERGTALARYAAETGFNEVFRDGELFHLYADWIWDELYFEDFRKAHETEGNWIAAYRGQITAAAAHIFNAYDFSGPLWERILAYDYGVFTDAMYGGGKLKGYLEHLYEWHKTLPPRPSKLYTPRLAEDFAAECAKSYVIWTNNIKKNIK